MRFRADTQYLSIPGSQTGGTLGYILEVLLKTRLRLKMDENQAEGEEEVNTYLGGVLVSYIDPEYLLSVSSFLSPYETGVYEAVAKTADDRVQSYWIYKANADDLLISLGIFRRSRLSEKQDLGRMKRYYAFASEYQKRIYGKATAVADVQARLAEGPERYLAILVGARRNYLSFIRQIGAGDLSELVRRIEQEQ